MNVKDLIFSMHIGEEIEIFIDGKGYFLQPDYDSSDENRAAHGISYPYTLLFDSESNEMLFRGTAEEIIEYVFAEKYTLKKDFEKFKLFG